MLLLADEPLKVTEENFALVKAHRPKLMILRGKRCPVCQSYLVGWKVSEWSRDAQGNRLSHSLSICVVCPFCRIATVEDPFMPDNDAPPLAVSPNPAGWVQCPCCGKRFGLTNSASWDGKRHRTCGQSLSLL